MNRRKGFTLLELIIVIIVIGILASIALPKFIKVTEKARISEAKSMLSAIRSAQIRYKAQWANYTDDISKLDIEFSGQGKYFDFKALNTGSDVGGAERNTTVQYSGDGYMVNISQDGVLTGIPSEYE